MTTKRSVRLLGYMLAGALLLSAMSAAQKRLLGGDPLLLRGYVVSALVGAVVGLVLERYQNRLEQCRRRLETEREELWAILDGIEGSVCVEDIQTHEVLYANRHMRQSCGDIVGQRCWEIARGEIRRVCDRCTDEQLLDADGEPGPAVTQEREAPQTGQWYRCAHRAIRWPDGRLVRMDVGFDITDCKETEARVQHLNTVLRAIRNVNQLITREQDRGLLIQGACDLLTQTRGYYNAWLALLDEENKLVTSAESGLAGDFEPMVERLQKGELTVCGVRAMAQADVVAIENPVTTCGDCPLAKAYRGRAAMSVRLESGGRTYGLLSVSIPTHLAADGEERSLLKEVAGDIAFALHTMEVEEDRKRAEAQAKRQQEQLMQADKMAALGTLVSGMGHEINNPNNFIMLNVPLLKGAWEDAFPILEQYAQEHRELRLRGIPFAQAREMLPQLHDDVLDGARRIQHLVEELKNYARPAEDKLDEEVDLNEAVRSAVNLMKSLIDKKTHAFSVHYGDDVPMVKGNAQQIEHVVVNLVQNACEALRGQEERVLVQTAWDEERQGVVLTVADEGTGISEDDLNRLADPFFTTKRSMGGTGLGLSIVARIVQNHQGVLDFESSPDEGTTATVFLPSVRTKEAKVS